MPLKRLGDLTLITSEQSDEMVPLETGAAFPVHLAVTGRLSTGLLFELSLSVEDGRPVLTHLALDRGSMLSALSATFLHELPVGELVDRVIDAVAGTTYLRAGGTSWAGMMAAGASAVGSQRGRPVGDDDLRKVAAAVRRNGFAPRQEVASALNISERTASRWIASAKAKFPELFEEEA